ncbi:D-TA family PLP-dependent enzyme [Galbibacter pacificus]|uniref:D-TA family PLP-dependent enzyme n=1 Tax=Galbibacter pacificus TaxID=2996052 RepID=A0ABT6FSM4_9FLAO|nr:D-TA family PLP-dependent enzyme [Galbibacter pacificus]MDG3582607.1 D-TA family PLP-dependent enzyme [Galbibacter pacificus]MDG3586274.1 D-TA family PLP-dependent enzyme [Galbibacter pacificus]
MKEKNWFEIENADEIATPALLVYPDRIQHNIKRMIEIASDVCRLRPHIKTHKTAEIIQMQQAYGIQKFKCATIAEAELLAQCKAKDVLLAMQPVGIHIQRFFKLMRTYPETQFSTLLDDMENAKNITEAAIKKQMKVSLWMDINVGMNRTGIEPGEEARKLFQFLDVNENVEAKGFHVYDGHLRDSNYDQRKKDCNTAFETVVALKESLKKMGVEVKEIIAGGSPSFPVHAMRNDVDLSPGTVLLWDAGYGDLFPEMKMLPATVLITRIISKPSKGIVTSDLGHKSLASEMPFPRVELLNAPDLEQLSQSEEHLVFNTKHPENYKIGDLLYAIPKHICPTVAKYQYLQVVEKGKVVNEWKVVARDQVISV